MTNYEILVNKENPIDENFEVENLISVGKSYSSEENKFTDKDIFLENETAIALKKMLDDANSIFSNCKVIPDSGYRSYAKQVEVLNYYIDKEGKEAAMKRVAMPGTSEHHTGLAIDIAILTEHDYIDDITGKEPAIAWLHEHSSEYGFILRYPEGTEDITGVRYEPWHFRYVGVELAKEITEKGMLLEEYYESKKCFR